MDSVSSTSTRCALGHPIIGPFVLGLLLGCSQSEPSLQQQHDEACAGEPGARAAVRYGHDVALRFDDVRGFFHPPWGGFLLDEMQRHYGAYPSTEVLYDRAREWREAPPLPITTDVLDAVETSLFCDGSTTRFRQWTVRRCGTSILLRPGGAPEPFIGFVDPDTGLFAARMFPAGEPGTSRDEFLIGYLYEDRTGYARHRHSGSAECAITDLVLRPPDRPCTLEGRYEGRFDLSLPRLSEGPRCVETPPNRGALVVESGQMTIETEHTVVTGPVDARCGAELVSADGDDRWSLHCDERGRCAGTRELTTTTCRWQWVVTGVHPP